MALTSSQIPVGIRIDGRINIFPVPNFGPATEKLMDLVGPGSLALDYNTGEMRIKRSAGVGLAKWAGGSGGTSYIFDNDSGLLLETGDRLKIKVDPAGGIELHALGARIKLAPNSGLVTDADGTKIDFIDTADLASVSETQAVTPRWVKDYTDTLEHGGEWEHDQFTFTAIDQATVSLSTEPETPSKVQFEIDGRMLRYGRDFTVTGTSVAFNLSPFAIEAGDQGQAYYFPKGSGGGGSGPVAQSPVAGTMFDVEMLEITQTHDFSGTFTDPDTPTADLRYSITSGPVWATIPDDTQPIAELSPPRGEANATPYVVTVQAEDPEGNSVSATFNVTVFDSFPFQIDGAGLVAKIGEPVYRADASVMGEGMVADNTTTARPTRVAGDGVRFSNPAHSMKLTAGVVNQGTDQDVMLSAALAIHSVSGSGTTVSLFGGTTPIHITADMDTPRIILNFGGYFPVFDVTTVPGFVFSDKHVYTVRTRGPLRSEIELFVDGIPTTITELGVDGPRDHGTSNELRASMTSVDFTLFDMRHQIGAISDGELRGIMTAQMGVTTPDFKSDGAKIIDAAPGLTNGLVWDLTDTSGLFSNNNLTKETTDAPGGLVESIADQSKYNMHGINTPGRALEGIVTAEGVQIQSSTARFQTQNNLGVVGTDPHFLSFTARYTDAPNGWSFRFGGGALGATREQYQFTLDTFPAGQMRNFIHWGNPFPILEPGIAHDFVDFHTYSLRWVAPDLHGMRYYVDNVETAHGLAPHAEMRALLDGVLLINNATTSTAPEYKSIVFGKGVLTDQEFDDLVTWQMSL